MIPLRLVFPRSPLQLWLEFSLCDEHNISLPPTHSVSVSCVTIFHRMRELAGLERYIYIYTDRWISYRGYSFVKENFCQRQIHCIRNNILPHFKCLSKASSSHGSSEWYDTVSRASAHNCRVLTTDPNFYKILIAITRWDRYMKHST